MKKICIESVDDGGEGFLRSYVNGEVIISNCELSFFTELLEALDYDIEWQNTEETE